MHRLFKSIALSLCLPACFANPIPLLAQSAPATPQSPDLLGIYIGMPAAAAKTQLQKHSAAPITPNGDPANGFQMQITDPKNADQIQVWLTRAPNNPAVWMEVRTQIYYPSAGGPPLSYQAVLDALHQKYGTETVSSDHPVSLVLYWIYDQNGKQAMNTAAAAKAAANKAQQDQINKANQNKPTF